MPKVECAYDQMAPVKELRLNPRNPNTHTTHQIRTLARIIGIQGWRAPITVSNRSGFIVRGHARHMAAELLKCETVPVDYQDYAGDEEEWADLVADNHIAKFAEMNEDLLADLIKEIEAAGYDSTLTGFDLDEIEELLARQSIETEPRDPGCRIEEVDELIEKWRPELGGIWESGEHRLMCGDATSREDISRLMAGKRADMVFADPPYNMDYKSNVLGGIENDRLGEAAFVRLILASTNNMVGALREGGSYYVCMSAAEYAMVIYQLRKLGYAGAPIIWVKPNIGLGAQEYRPQFEVILYGYKGSRKKRTWNGKRKESNLWDLDPDRGVAARKADGGGMILEFGLGFNTVSVLFNKYLDGTVINEDGATSDLWQIAREYVGGYVHPTQKPTALVKRAILNSTEKGDLVVDGFLGSGTTMVAAEESGRVCYGIEQDERFVAVNLERMKHMGLEPVRIDKVH